MNLDAFYKGVEKHINLSSEKDLDYWDSVDTDLIIQYALFGKVVYG